MEGSTTIASNCWLQDLDLRKLGNSGERKSGAATTG